MIWFFLAFFLILERFRYSSEKHNKKVAPGIDTYFFISQKILASIFGSLKCNFQKYTFLGPQLNRLGLVWYLLNLLKAPASLGSETLYLLLRPIF